MSAQPPQLLRPAAFICYRIFRPEKLLSAVLAAALAGSAVEHRRPCLAILANFR